MTVYQVHPGETSRKALAEIQSDDSGFGPQAARYMHQVLATQDWYVMFEGPCFGAFGMWDWRPEAGTRIRLVNRKTAEQKLYHITTNYFTTHQVNTFQDGDDLVADIVSSECGCEKRCCQLQAINIEGRRYAY